MRTIFMSSQLITYVSSLLLNAKRCVSKMLASVVWSTPFEMAIT